MDWAEVDTLLWLLLVLTLGNFLIKSGVSLAGAKGWISSDTTNGILSFML